MDDLFTNQEDNERKRKELKDQGWWPNLNDITGRYGWRSPQGEILTEEDAFKRAFGDEKDG